MVDIRRRDFAKIASMAAAGTGLSTLSGAAKAVTPTVKAFPAGFKWGCATAAYQIEGAVHEDGRGQTIWDTFSHTPGKILGGTNGDVACDSYHRYQDDTRLLKNLGCNAYRLSFAWARFFPEGRGKVNQKGVDHYRRVVDNLLENGIEPYVSLYHWDLPQALKGGWQSRDTAAAFADYAGYVARVFSDRVQHFITTNEIAAFCDAGYASGEHAPGLQLNPRDHNQVRHHGVLAQGMGVQAVRANARAGTMVGPAENLTVYVPVVETPANIEAARKATRIGNAPFMTAIMEGQYLDSYLEGQGANAPRVAPGDMAIIGSPVDFLGINCYSSQYVVADDSAQGFRPIAPEPASPRTQLTFVTPDGPYWGVRLASELWGPKTIYISENGASFPDNFEHGRVDDTARVMYLREYISSVHRAASEGYPLKGYFLWSLLDNFEWAQGFEQRFGIHYTDYATQQRIPKLSAMWYRELIARNAMV